MNPEVEREIDGLFALPLDQFTAARNALAGRLKKTRQREEAEMVKAIAKPSVSAWAVNQLYWKHREAFNELIAAGERVLAAQTSQFAGKGGDPRQPLEARREVLSRLSRLAATMLHEAGHDPTPDKMRRLSTTLEAISSRGSNPVGRLTEDIDPPGFELFATLMPTGPKTAKDVRKPDKAALKKAVHVLAEARVRALHAAAQVQKARERLSAATAEAEEAANAVRQAERAVEEASRESQP